MPAFSGFAFDAFSRNRSVEFYHRFAPLDRSVGAAADSRAGFQKRLPRIGSAKAIEAEPRRRKKQITDRVRRLHRRDHAQFGEARNIGWIENLGVFYAPAWLAHFALLRRRRLKCV